MLYAKLRGLMAENDETQADLGRALKLSRNAVSDHFRNRTDWGLSECYFILDHYHQPHESLPKVFPPGGKRYE